MNQPDLNATPLPFLKPQGPGRPVQKHGWSAFPGTRFPSPVWTLRRCHELEFSSQELRCSPFWNGWPAETAAVPASSRCCRLGSASGHVPSAPCPRCQFLRSVSELVPRCRERGALHPPCANQPPRLPKEASRCPSPRREFQFRRKFSEPRKRCVVVKPGSGLCLSPC